jgi:hypothetical protein
MNIDQLRKICLGFPGVALRESGTGGIRRFDGAIHFARAK